MANELERISRAVGKEGKINQRASVSQCDGLGCSRRLIVNSLISDLMQPSTEIARVITAVAKGDLTRRCRSKSKDGARKASSPAPRKW